MHVDSADILPVKKCWNASEFWVFVVDLEENLPRAHYSGVAWYSIERLLGPRAHYLKQIAVSHYHSIIPVKRVKLLTEAQKVYNVSKKRWQPPTSSYKSVYNRKHESLNGKFLFLRSISDYEIFLVSHILYINSMITRRLTKKKDNNYLLTYLDGPPLLALRA